MACRSHRGSRIHLGSRASTFNFRGRRLLRLAATAAVVGSIGTGLTGCRQTTGPAVNGPLQPFTAPDGSTTGPALLPFGNPSGARVAPPTTGAGTAGTLQPNNYMGGATSAIPNSGTNSVAATSATGMGQRNIAGPIGSGVVQTGFTTSADSPDSGTNAIRAGGMQVIDLTQSPPPPGYMPSKQPTGIGVSGSAAQVNGSIYDSSVARGDGRAAFPAQPLQPTTGVATGAAPRVRISGPPVIGNQGSGFTNTPPSPHSAGGTTVMPSTQPMGPSNGFGNELQWRQPAAAF